MSLLVLEWSKAAPPVTVGWISPLGRTLELVGADEAITTINGFPSGGSAEGISAADATAAFQSKDTDLTQIASLSGTAGLLKKTNDGWSLDTAVYLTSALEQITDGGNF